MKKVSCIYRDGCLRGIACQVAQHCLGRYRREGGEAADAEVPNGFAPADTSGEQSLGPGSTPGTSPIDDIINRHIELSGQMHLFQRVADTYSTGTKRMMRMSIHPVLLAAAMSAALHGMILAIREAGKVPPEFAQAVARSIAESAHLELTDPAKRLSDLSLLVAKMSESEGVRAPATIETSYAHAVLRLLIDFIEQKVTLENALVVLSEISP